MLVLVAVSVSRLHSKTKFVKGNAASGDFYGLSSQCHCHIVLVCPKETNKQSKAILQAGLPLPICYTLSEPKLRSIQLFIFNSYWYSVAVKFHDSSSPPPALPTTTAAAATATATATTTTTTTTITTSKLFNNTVFQHCLYVGHMIVSCYIVRSFHFKFFKVADDVLFGNNSTFVPTHSQLFHLHSPHVCWVVYKYTTR